jgi:hypothetical protein
LGVCTAGRHLEGAVAKLAGSFADEDGNGVDDAVDATRETLRRHSKVRCGCEV